MLSENVIQKKSRSFVLPPNLGRQGLLHISMPTFEESAAVPALIYAPFFSNKMVNRDQSTIFHGHLLREKCRVKLKLSLTIVTQKPILIVEGVISSYFFQSSEINLFI
jgi:hypothetical protein